MAFITVPIDAQADEYWRAGLIYFRRHMDYNYRGDDGGWLRDADQSRESFAPTKYYPEEYEYAIYVED